MSYVFIAVVMWGLVGCARYEFDVVEPAQFAGRAGKSDYVFEREPLEYKLRSVSNRLVMRIYNSTNDSITLQGQQSTVVDPDEQSHPLLTQTIAPRSFIKLIFPPPRPYIEGYGPAFGVGVYGVYGSSRASPYYPYYYEGTYSDASEPRYFAVYDDLDTYFWDWKGEGQMRLSLVFERGEQTFTHDFVIGRKRVK